MTLADLLGCQHSAACLVAVEFAAGVNAKTAPSAKPCVLAGVAAIAAAGIAADMDNW
jgi:hypothetical protein